MNAVEIRSQLPPVSFEEKRAVALPAWYDRLRGLTPRTRFIPISETQTLNRFLNYLRADGVFLPSSVPEAPVNGDVEGDAVDWEDGDDVQHRAGEIRTSPNFDLSEVQIAIGSVLQELSPGGHGVFLKTNWSAPKDASFVIGSLQVQAIADALAILKSSSCTALDLDACAACGCLPTLCLRSFVAVPPQHEFRVFVVSGVAVAASQRHLHQFFPHLHQNLQEWRQRIFDFCSLISCKLPLPSCVIDIAFTDQSPNGLVIDLDALCSDTDTLLFSPQDIYAAASTAAGSPGSPLPLELRVLLDDSGLQPSPAMLHGIPLDLQMTDAHDLQAAVLRIQSETMQP